MATFNLAKDQLSTERIQRSHLVVYPMPSDIRQPAWQPGNPAPLLAPHCLLCAVAAENSLEVSEVFREIQLQTESGRRSKKLHFDLSRDVGSSLLVCLWTFLYNPLSPSFSLSLEAGKYAFKLIFFWLHEWALKSFPPTPNTQPTPTITSTETSTFSELNPTQSKHLQAVISHSSPLCVSPLPSLIPPTPVHSFPVKMLAGYQGNPINSPSFKC